MRDETGQAAMEYTLLLAVVAAALAAAGAAGGLPAVAGAVTASVRTGICLVAGDVCRASDAAAAGLEPCTVSERTRGEGLTVAVMSVRLGADEAWTAATRSDGSVLVTRRDDRTVGGALGVGVAASPLGIDVGVGGKLEHRVGRGEAWEFADIDAALRFLKGERDGVEPVWRYGEAKAVLAGEAAGGAGGMKLTALESTAEAAAGVRVGRGGTTYYVRARLDALDGMVGTSGLRERFEGPGASDAIVELTRDGRGLRELAFRSVERGVRDGEVVETVARLDLLEPANRAAAEPLLALRLPWPPAAARELGVLARRAVRTGIVERFVYDVRDESEAMELSVKAGVVLGLDGREVDVERRLVAASAWTNGSRERERGDCAGTAAGLGRTS